jgi:hypothetical protein
VKFSVCVGICGQIYWSLSKIFVSMETSNAKPLRKTNRSRALGWAFIDS